MTMRWVGGGIAAAGWMAILWWAATAGSNPTAVTGSFDVPAIGFLVVIVGFFVWLAGMVRGERVIRHSWGELERRQAPAGYMDTFVFKALAASPLRRSSERAVARPPRSPAGGTGGAPRMRDRVSESSRPRGPGDRTRGPSVPVARKPHPSPVALAVLDSIELRRLETGEAPLPIEVRRAIAPDSAEPEVPAAMPRPATAAARARA